MRDDKIKKIDSVSESFCLAKYLQTSLNLEIGTTHSCHNTPRELINITDLNEDISALHSTKLKFAERKKMRDGQRPMGCDYCWKIENSNDQISDRYIKSTDPWAFDKLVSIVEKGPEFNFPPTYLEVMFSRICNLSCIYCSPDFSSSIASEMNKYGPYPLKTFDFRMEENYQSFSSHNSNVLKESFWLYLKEIINQLRVLRITGGEPLLQSELDKLFLFLKSEGHPELTFSINSNLMVNESQLQKLSQHIAELKSTNKIKHFELYASIDSTKDKAEYIRQGLSSNTFFKNLTYLNNCIPNLQIVLMCSYSILSVCGLRPLLNKVKTLRSNGFNLTIDIAHVTKPQILQASITTPNLLKLAISDLNFMRTNHFLSYEIEKFERIISWMKASLHKNEITFLRAEFFRLIEEYDKRYNIRFDQVFPEMNNFMSICKKAHHFENL